MCSGSPSDLSQAEGAGRAVSPSSASKVQSQPEMVHIHRQHPHPVLRRIAHDLRGRIEAHRLRIEQTASKGGGGNGISASSTRKTSCAKLAA